MPSRLVLLKWSEFLADNNDDYSESAIKERQKFVEEYTGKKLEHITKYSFDPHLTMGNCESFTGVAQVPMGFAGPGKSMVNTLRANTSYRWLPPKVRSWHPTTVA